MNIKYLILAFIIVICSAVAFVAGRHYEEYYYNYDSLYEKYKEYKEFYTNHQGNKDYQMACVLADASRCMVDHLGVDAEEILEEYIDNLECDSVLSITRKDYDNYYWSY